jgi:hypothetical protein
MSSSLTIMVSFKRSLASTSEEYFHMQELHDYVYVLCEFLHVKHIALFDILQVSLIGGVMEVFGTFHSQSIKGIYSISGRVKDGNI